MNTTKTVALIADLANAGYGVYNAGPWFCVADPRDDEDGFYMEDASLQEVVEAAHLHLFHMVLV